MGDMRRVAGFFKVWGGFLPRSTGGLPQWAGAEHVTSLRGVQARAVSTHTSGSLRPGPRYEAGLGGTADPATHSSEAARR